MPSEDAGTPAHPERTRARNGASGSIRNARNSASTMTRAEPAGDLAASIVGPKEPQRQCPSLISRYALQASEREFTATPGVPRRRGARTMHPREPVDPHPPRQRPRVSHRAPRPRRPPPRVPENRVGRRIFPSNARMGTADGTLRGAIRSDEPAKDPVTYSPGPSRAPRCRPKSFMAPKNATRDPRRWHASKQHLGQRTKPRAATGAHRSRAGPPSNAALTQPQRGTQQLGSRAVERQTRLPLRIVGEGGHPGARMGAHELPIRRRRRPCYTAHRPHGLPAKRAEETRPGRRAGEGTAGGVAENPGRRAPPRTSSRSVDI